MSDGLCTPPPSLLPATCLGNEPSPSCACSPRLVIMAAACSLAAASLRAPAPRRARQCRHQLRVAAWDFGQQASSPRRRRCSQAAPLLPPLLSAVTLVLLRCCRRRVPEGCHVLSGGPPSSLASDDLHEPQTCVARQLSTSKTAPCRSTRTASGAPARSRSSGGCWRSGGWVAPTGWVVGARHTIDGGGEVPCPPAHPPTRRPPSGRTPFQNRFAALCCAVLCAGSAT